MLVLADASEVRLIEVHGSPFWMFAGGFIAGMRFGAEIVEGQSEAMRTNELKGFHVFDPELCLPSRPRPLVCRRMLRPGSFVPFTMIGECGRELCTSSR